MAIYNKQKCVRCGKSRDLQYHELASFSISRDSNPNIQTFQDCYVCKDCEFSRFKCSNPAKCFLDSGKVSPGNIKVKMSMEHGR